MSRLVQQEFLNEDFSLLQLPKSLRQPHLLAIETAFTLSELRS